MQREPQPEIMVVYRHCFGGGGDVWLDEVQLATRYRLLAEQREVVLAQHSAGKIAEQQPDLRRKHRLIEAADERYCCGRGHIARRVQPFERREEIGKGANVRLDPVRAVKYVNVFHRLG